MALVWGSFSSPGSTPHRGACGMRHMKVGRDVGQGQAVGKRLLVSFIMGYGIAHFLENG